MPQGHVVTANRAIEADLGPGKDNICFMVTLPAFDEVWLSGHRFAEYRDAADGDDALARELYEWDSAVSSALFEVIRHVEVLIRNAIMLQLEKISISSGLLPGTPWIQQKAELDKVIGRISKAGKKPTVHRIVAGQSFGFWATLFETVYEDLWRSNLRFAFPGSPGDRKSVLALMRGVNRLRNTVAHHGAIHDVWLLE